MGGCAANYRLVEPERLPYQSQVKTSAVDLAVQSHALALRGNQRYERKLQKKRLQWLCVRIINQDTVAKRWGEDIWLEAEGKRIEEMQPLVAAKELRQPTGIYLLYSLLIVFPQSCNGTTCRRIPVPFGLPIGVGNMVFASGSNQRMAKELVQYDLQGKEVAPGDTLYGITIFSGWREAGIRLGQR